VFSQIVQLKKAMSKWTFFCISSVFGTLLEDLLTFHCCQWQKFAIKTLLCNTDCLYTVDSDVQPNNRHRMHVLYFEATLVMPVCHSIVLYVHCFSC